MSFTFKVNDVSGRKVYDGDKPERQLVEMPKIFKGLGKFEAFGGPEKIIRTYGPQNGLWRACEAAYNNHRRLELSPDHIWLAIARVAAEHITSKSEELRKKFVDFEGKKALEIRRNEFVKGSPDNDWPGTFEEFASQIDKNVKPEVADVFVSNFTTTGPIESAVSRVILMDAMSRYFNFVMHTLCGIPEITILGEKSDWCDVFEKVGKLGDLVEGMRPWLSKVADFVNHFVLAASGVPDLDWWKNFYQEGGGSGINYFNGHLAVLFPEKTDDGDLVVPSRVNDDKIPHSLSRVPVLWKYYDQEFRMRFVAGIPFATVLGDGAVTPAAAWAIEEV